MRNYLLGLILLVYFGTLSASQDLDYIAAREAFQAGNAKRLDEHAAKLQHHVLWPYVEYFKLRMRLQSTDIASIRYFLTRYDGDLVADRLRGDWLKLLGKNQQWSLFETEYPLSVNKDTELLCYYYQNRLNARDISVLREVRSLWLTPTSQPDSCTPVFRTLIHGGQITLEDIWTRIRLALEEGQTGVATHINRYLPSNESLNNTDLNNAAKNPLRYLDTLNTRIKSRSDREIALFALLRLLRNDTNQAYVQWSKIKSQLTPFDRSYFLGRLGYRAAMRHDSRALDWFREAQNTPQTYPPSDTVLAWQARAALRAAHWDEVLRTIDKMSSTEQQIDTWRYWKARAFIAKGKTQDANNILIPLSSEHSFYGQLAREELGSMLSITDKIYRANNSEVSAMERKPGIQRTMAFARMNLRTEAFREWSWTIRQFSDAELLAASEVARRQGMYDRAINTANRTITQHDFSLRFLSPHREALRNVLRRHELDEAWVYGLIRQESRFIADIKSHAGATGLMQLMPATAEWVAKQLGIPNFRQNLVSDVNTNLQLGTYYLKHVLNTLDNQPLLASAAYNAGPGRARRWRDDTRILEGAIYAETIPFNETRDYVKKVLKNSMYYAKVLEHGHDSPTLKERLGIVRAK
ncbi:lytic transglycosylase domain-containing protein [Nitrosomonas supralitoralis]|uniref:Transglycosylase n=1 Tax=Nitrosomonas supralitoralis TaxID=2116706 RepID=A0A2P7NWK9_9PROT|nr:lytic transglycosylase domain-containing protein [Nitrosomonas supralitoralis]PSJ17815.1 transglycosylase [Nitrosomonas supralitoralis]